MKEKEFRKIVKEEIRNILSETTKGDIISQIYMWIIKGNMRKAMQAMQNDPELMRLANNVEELKKELLKRMSEDDNFGEFLLKTVKQMKNSRE